MPGVDLRPPRAPGSPDGRQSRLHPRPPAALRGPAERRARAGPRGRGRRGGHTLVARDRRPGRARRGYEAGRRPRRGRGPAGKDACQWTRHPGSWSSSRTCRSRSTAASGTRSPHSGPPVTRSRQSVARPRVRGGLRAVDGVHVYRHDLPVEADRAFDYFREYAYALWSELRLARRVRREQGFDVVHICNPPDLLFLVATWFKYLHGTAVIFDQHDVGPELYEAKFGRRDALYRVLRLSERLSFARGGRRHRHERVVPVGGRRQGAHGPGRRVRRAQRPRPRALPKGGGRGDAPAHPPPSRRATRAPWVTRRASTTSFAAVRYLVRDLGRDDVSFVVIGGGTGARGVKGAGRRPRRREYVEFTGRESQTPS